MSTNQLIQHLVYFLDSYIKNEIVSFQVKETIFYECAQFLLARHLGLFAKDVNLLSEK